MYSVQKFVTALFFICLPFFLHCQTVKASEADKKDGHVFINRFIGYVKSSSIISFDSAGKQFLRNKFSWLPEKNMILKGYDPSFYWFRFIVQNDDTISTNLVFTQGGLGTRDAELWQSLNGKYVSLGKTGYKYPFSKRPYRNLHYHYPITIAPNSIDTFYLYKDESHAYKVIAFGLIRPEKLTKWETDFYFKFGILIGILVLFIFINLYLYVAIKEKIHLWYSSYLLFTLFFIIKDEGLDMEFLGLDSELAYRITSMGAIGTWAIGLQVQVVQMFLVNISKKSFLYRLLSVIKWSCWAGGTAFWIVFYVQPDNFIETFVYEWANKSTLAAFFTIPVICIYSYRKGFKPALFIISGMAFFITGAILRVLFIPVNSFLFRPTYFEIGLVMEAIIISFGLMYRYNQFRKEKENLKAELEIQQKEATKQVLVAQEAEQKRIAEDLHDELGGNLAVIKMTLQRFNLPELQSTELNQLIDKASTNARNISHNLMPPEFAETSLKELLENYFRRLNTENSIHFYFHYTGDNNHFDKQEELMIYRIVMELSNNILKHSKATEATIQFIYNENQLSLIVEDNGSGFYNDQSKGIGLKNIRSRVKYLNGSLTIDTGDNGTTIIIQLPYNEINK
jgi:signal transduction histidine kinase